MKDDEKIQKISKFLIQDIPLYYNNNKTGKKNEVASDMY
jgi:hypothetical protein